MCLPHGYVELHPPAFDVLIGWRRLHNRDLALQLLDILLPKHQLTQLLRARGTKQTPRALKAGS